MGKDRNTLKEGVRNMQRANMKLKKGCLVKKVILEARKDGEKLRDAQTQAEKGMKTKS